MSRHRNVRNINIEEELEEDYDADYCGRSFDDDSFSSSSGNSNYCYNRRQELTYASKANNNINDEFFQENELKNIVQNTKAEEVFFIDKKPTPQKPKLDVTSKNASKLSLAFVIGEPKWMSTPVQKKNLKNVAATPVPPSIESLRVSKKKSSRPNSKSPSRMTPNSSFQRLSALDVALSTTSILKLRTRPNNTQRSFNLVIVGHVDAGKSTLVGHLLYLLGNVDDKTMHKNRQESARVGKSSFAFAWILDEGEEERSRGVTMDIARVSFQSQRRIYNILDAPGHKDFIPNMITGASQADAGLLVINAKRGEFETGFDQGGQTREHALLLRSLGVSKVIVAINKLDTIDWSENRFDEVSASLKLFLRKQAGFDDVKFVPVSGLLGTNIIEHVPENHPLFSWYNNGPTLLETLDSLPEPNRLEDKPLRIVVNDVLRLTVNSANLSGKVESGSIENGEKLFIMPDANPIVVKSVLFDDISEVSSILRQQSNSQATNQTQNICYAGDQILLTVAGSFEPDSIYPGHVLCRGGLTELLAPVRHFAAKIVVFDIQIPIFKGTRVEFFAHSLRVSSVIVRLKSLINKSTKKTIKENPRVLTKNMSALVEIKTDLPVSIEPYPKTLCRFTLRANNQTIAAGIVDQILK